MASIIIGTIIIFILYSMTFSELSGKIQLFIGVFALLKPGIESHVIYKIDIMQINK